MIIKKHSSIPNEDHIMRYIPWNKLRKDENDQIIGVTGEAFKLRVDEKYLSATWIEFFKTETFNNNLNKAVKQFREGTFKVTPKSGFAIGKIENIKNTCIQKRNIKIHITYYPTNNNSAHVAVVKDVPDEDFELLELIASESAWGEKIVLNSEII